MSTSSEQFSVQGDSWGLQDMSFRVRGGASSCHASSWISNSVIACKITWLSMPFSQFKVSISSERFAYIVGKNLSFIPLVAIELQDIHVLNRLTTGSVITGILGSGFTPISATLKVRMGKTTCESSSWFSFSSLSCKFSAAGSSMAATVGVLVSIFATNFQKTANASSRLPIHFSSQEYLHLPSSGAFSLIFLGSGIATSSTSARTGSSAALSALWFSDSEVLAKSGVFLHLKGAKSVTVSCHERVYAATSDTIMIRTYNVSVVDNGFPNTGSLRLDLRGNSFGTAMTTHAITLGITRSENSIWESDSSLFEKPSRDFNKLLKALTLTILCEIGSTTFSFHSPIEVASLFGTVLSTGSTLVYLTGKMFSNYDKSTIFRLENTGMSATNWISHSSSWCKLPATQRLQTQSIRLTHSTAIIDLSSSHIQELFVIQELILTIRTGSSIVNMILMSGDVSSRMRFGNSAVASTLWLSGTSITARLCAFSSSEVLHMAISSYRNCSFAGRGSPIAIIGNLTALEHSTSAQTATSSHIIMMQGSGLFLTDNSCKLRSGATAGESSEWVSDSGVRCRTGSANWYKNGVVVSFRDSIAKWTPVPTNLNRNAASLWSLEIITGFLPTTGSVNMNILGNGWGAHDESVRCKLGFTTIIASAWKSDSAINAKLSAGVGRVENLMISLKPNVQQQQFRQHVKNFGTPEISSLRAIEDGILFVQGSSMGSLEPKQIVSYHSVHHLQGLLLTELAALRIFNISESGRMIDFQMKVVLEKFSRLDGLTISLLSPTGVSFPLIRNKCKGCYSSRIQFQLSDNPSTKIPDSNCNDGNFRFDHFPVLRELLLESAGDWKIFAAAGAERDFATISVQIDIHVQDYLGLLNAKERAVFDMWNSDSGLSMIRGTFNARNLEPNIIISGQIGRNLAEPIFAEYTPSLETVICLHFPETGSSLMTIVGSDLAQAVFVGDKSREGFDRASLSAVIKAGDTSCESSPWRSQSSILCKTTGRPLADDQSIAIAITIANAVATTWLELPELGVSY